MSNAVDDMFDDLIEEKNLEIIKLTKIIKQAGLHKEAPCCLCGYNGLNYHQPEVHNCMEDI